MQLITEMGIPEYLLLKIISGYRIVAKIDELTCGGYNGPLEGLLDFLTDMMPAMARTFVNGDITDERMELRDLVLSDSSDEEVMRVLL